MAGSILLDIAAETQASEIVFSQAVIGVYQVVPADPLRYSIGFCLNVAATFTLSSDPSNDGTTGIPIAGGQLIELDVRRWGSLVQGAWYVAITGPSQCLMTIFTVRFPRG